MTRRHIYIFTLILTSIFGLYILKLNMPFILAKIPHFKVEKMEIHGLESMGVRAFVSNLGITRKVSLLSLNRAEIKKRVEGNPRFILESVDWNFPDTLVLWIKERKGVLIVKEGNEYKEIDSEGVVIATNEHIFSFDRPIVQRSPKEKKAPPLLDSLLFREMLASMAKIPEGEKDLLDAVSEVTLGERTEMYLRSQPLRVILSPIVSLGELRKARYGLVYVSTLRRPVREMDVRHPFVRYSFR